MLSQWDCLLKNLGFWHGSFTRLSSKGEFLEDTPTIVSLEGRDDNKSIYQVVRYLYPDQPPQDKVFQFSSLNRSILFFENGAFSQGYLQWGPFSEFGAESGLIDGNRRLRMVTLFNSSSEFDRFTLIREKLPDSNTPERQHLTIEQLIGEWSGKAVTIYPDFRHPDTYDTHLKIERQGNDRITQKLSFGERQITSSARIEGSILYFDESDLTVQVLLLADGASCSCPVTIKPRHAFFIEMGWLLQPEKRQRLIRSYSDKGEWVSVTLVTEEKVG